MASGCRARRAAANTYPCRHSASMDFVIVDPTHHAKKIHAKAATHRDHDRNNLTGGSLASYSPTRWKTHLPAVLCNQKTPSPIASPMTTPIDVPTVPAFRPARMAPEQTLTPANRLRKSQNIAICLCSKDQQTQPCRYRSAWRHPQRCLALAPCPAS